MRRTKPKLLKPPAAPNATANGIGETPEVLTLEEAASYFRVPAEAVLRMIDTEGFPARRFGADYLVASRAGITTPGSVLNRA
jgi:excisionase family DNA binding protein